LQRARIGRSGKKQELAIRAEGRLGGVGEGVANRGALAAVEIV
jgi:hypothetical protein